MCHLTNHWKSILRLWFLLSCLLFFFSGCCHRNLKVSNEAVILIHGFARSRSDMRKLGRALRYQGYQVHTINYSSIRRNIKNIQSDAFQQIDNKLSQISADKIHFVGHSLGGLLIRSYLGKKTIPKLGAVVMIGSPSKGTHFVDYYKDSWWFKFFGSVTRIFSAEGSQFLNSLKPPNYPLGVIAGNFNVRFQEHILPGLDDGLVPVESTKIKGMKDFVLIQNTTHRGMLFQRKVVEQVIYFLMNEKFNHPSPK